jgi:DNA repair protein SbcD/Mre11
LASKVLSVGCHTGVVSSERINIPGDGSMVRILHIADVHLDTTFLARPEHRGLLQEACRRAFRNTIDAAIENGVHVLLIAGDLFDGERLSLATELFLVEQLRRLDQHGIPCVYVTGNHDPGGSRYRAQHLEWPESFSLVKGKRVETIPVLDADGIPLLNIVAAGHVSAGVTDNLAASFPPKDSAVPHVGLLHTMVQSAFRADDHDVYAPSTEADLLRTGYDYWALGHIHVRQEVSKTANAWYSGNVMGRSPRETGPKGGNLVEVGAGGSIEVSFIRLSDVQWASLQIDDLSACSTIESLRAHIASRVSGYVTDFDGVEHWFFRIELAGPCSLVDRLRDTDELVALEERIAADLGLAWIQIRSRRVTAPIDIAEQRAQQHVLAEALAQIEALRADPSAARELLETWANEPDESYVAELLAEMDMLVAERYLVTAGGKS